MDSKRVRAGVLGIAVVLLFFGSFTLVREGRIWVSPDEMANAYFAETFARTGSLFVFDAYNVTFDDALYPRSVVSVDGRLVPAGFLGLPVLYGAIASVLGRWVIPVLTPVVAALAVLCWWAITRRLFDREIAWLSAVLLAVHPAWWYYSARTLMPNVLFASLLIFCGWFLVARPLRAWMDRGIGLRLPVWVADLDVAVGGVSLGAALFVRPAEAWWVLGGVLLMGFFHRRAISWKHGVMFIAAIVFALLPLPFLNRDLYGSAFSFGYHVGQTASEAVLMQGDSVIVDSAPDAWQAFQEWISPVFPFGFHPRNVLRHVSWYGLSLFWWMTMLALIGIPMLVAGRNQPKDVRMHQRAYALLALASAAYLLPMYGSWAFHDNPDPETISIANSYVRYWIPLFIFSTPFAAYAIRWVYQRALTPIAQAMALSAMLLLCLGLSVRVVFFSPGDGLVYAAHGLQEAEAIQEGVLSQTEKESVIIVDRADKFFWPHRHVRQPLRDEDTYRLMPEIALLYPLYYYGITFPQQDLDYLNGVKLKEHGLQIILLSTYGAESLYRIYLSN